MLKQYNPSLDIMCYISNPANYKRARKKQYSIWCCMPKLGTQVYNKLEDIDYTTNEYNRFVLSGTRGEVWVIGADVNTKAKTPQEIWLANIARLANSYTFEDNTPITPQALQARIKDDCIDWFKIRSKPNASRLWACFIPVEYTSTQITSQRGTVYTANRPGIEHGLGDFIVAQDNHNQPDLGNWRVVNGAVFEDTYNNQGWTDCLLLTKGTMLAHKPAVSASCIGSDKAFKIWRDGNLKNIIGLDDFRSKTHLVNLLDASVNPNAALLHNLILNTPLRDFRFQPRLTETIYANGVRGGDLKYELLLGVRDNLDIQAIETDSNNFVYEIYAPDGSLVHKDCRCVLHSFIPKSSDTKFIVDSIASVILNLKRYYDSSAPTRNIQPNPNLGTTPEAILTKAYSMLDSTSPQSRKGLEAFISEYRGNKMILAAITAFHPYMKALQGKIITHGGTINGIYASSLKGTCPDKKTIKITPMRPSYRVRKITAMQDYNIPYVTWEAIVGNLRFRCILNTTYWGAYYCEISVYPLGANKQLYASRVVPLKITLAGGIDIINMLFYMLPNGIFKSLNS